MDLSQSPFTILIVDDDEGHVELVRRNLRRIAVGNPIVSLQNGARALDFIFRRAEFSARRGTDLLILLDTVRTVLWGGVRDPQPALRFLLPQRSTRSAEAA